MRETSTTKPKVVVIGGGGGNHALLKVFKEYFDDLTALVTMSDDGGSTGVLRNELGVLPAGDVRQCLVALAQDEQAAKIFGYRFGDGFLAGHSMGNLFLAAAEKETENFAEAVELTGRILQIKGRILPITLTDCRLVMESSEGTIIGEDTIRDLSAAKMKQSKLYLTPQAEAYAPALQAIQEADMVIIAPGNLYGTTLPALIVDGVAEALQTTNAKVVYVTNLLSLYDETLTVDDYVQELERFIGHNTIDYVLYNTDEPSAEMLKTQALETEFPIDTDRKQFENVSYKAVGGHFLSREKYTRNPNDIRIVRSLIRHDAKAVADAVLEIQHAA